MFILARASKSTWTGLERRICRQFGGERTPLSGGASRHTRGDCIQTDPFYIEIKMRAKIPFNKDWDECKANAKLEGKTPLFVMHQKGTHENIIFMSLSDFMKIKNGEKL